MLGEEGTEQFEVETTVEGELIRKQQIHDPFICTTVGVVLNRWAAFKQCLRPTPIKVQVRVGGTHAAMSRIMMMDPVEMQRENEEWKQAAIDGRSIVGIQITQARSE